jgi:hypothetical protein
LALIEQALARTEFDEVWNVLQAISRREMAECMVQG